MKKIIAYQIVEAKTVSGYLKDGWQPWGSPVATVDERHKVYLHQAIVKYEER